ncbi:MAG TPA: efflux RND transporter periplasmic adaptor subunit [Flavihumibacter sp.]|jgi:RND family efflux transporter MFP subunit
MNKTIKTILILALVGGSFGVIAYVLKKNKAEAAEKTAIVAQTNSSVAVRVDTVAKASPNIEVVANGNFAPYQELAFASEKSGRIVSVLVKEGDHVRKGQVLATIRVDQLNVDAQTAQANYQTALTDLARYENAFKTGGVTQQQLDQARLNVANAKARVEQTTINLNDASIRATIDGVINTRKIEPGSVVAPGTPLFDIVNISRLKLKVKVSEAQVAQLKIGKEVAIKVSVLPDKKFTGKVSFIAAKADEALNFPVEIDVLSNPGNELRAGMYGTAVFDFGQVAPVIMVPRNAFVGSVNSNEVFVVRDNKAELMKVTSGRILGNQVEILDGLNEGDLVITSGQINLVSGTAVNIIQ